MVSWSISVKTVGGQGLTNTSATIDGLENTAVKPSPTNFTVHVAPNDSLLTLHKQIESVTGLKASQQRLIYRGKLISSGAEGETVPNLEGDENPSTLSKIRVCDVDGLNDGQTIHLVPKPSVESSSRSDQSSTATMDNTGADSFDPGSTISGDVGAGLLTALLGLGTSGMIPVQAGEINLSDLSSLRPSRTGTRAARSVARRRRVNAHRRLATDPRYPPLAPLEPVRQGMMTLHTMMESRKSLEERTRNHPLETPRRFYRGQWIDARDTVNQWCEATIVEVLSPEEILKIPASSRFFNTNARSMNSKRRMIVPPSDSAVAANDIEGRRRLLLEPCENMTDSNYLAQLSGDDTLQGFRERSHNENVQILLIHYNGWPHRWDEWIRSDSERIRPFRTRSKMSILQASHCPMPQNSFDSSPSTHVVKSEDASDRPYIIPELQRALTMVSDLFKSAIESDFSNTAPEGSSCPLQDIKRSSSIDSTDNEPHLNGSVVKNDTIQSVPHFLPWLNTHRYRDQMNNDLDEVEKTDDSSVLIEADIPNLPRYNKRKLELLAPLLDRLGRVLLDTAPHIAALAEVLPETDVGDVAPCARPVSEQVESTSKSLIEPSLSDIDDDEPSSDDTDTMEVDPDHNDFVNGFVNFLNGDGVPTTNVRRNLRSASSNGVGPSLFNAPDEDNSPPSARFIRLGGGNGATGTTGGGIDIHIHAIVTGAGINTMGGGLPFMSGISNLINESSSSSRQSQTSVTAVVENPSPRDEDDLGLFSDLYTDAPSMATTTHDTFDVDRRDVDSSAQGIHYSEACTVTDLNHHNVVDDTHVPTLHSLNTITEEPSPSQESLPVEPETRNGNQLVTSVDAQTSPPANDGVGRQHSRSSIASAFRRALGRGCR